MDEQLRTKHVKVSFVCLFLRVYTGVCRRISLVIFSKKAVMTENMAQPFLEHALAVLSGL